MCLCGVRESEKICTPGGKLWVVGEKLRALKRKMHLIQEQKASNTRDFGFYTPQMYTQKHILKICQILISIVKKKKKKKKDLM